MWCSTTARFTTPSVVEADTYKDLALLKIGATGLTAAPLGNSDKMEVMDIGDGHWVSALVH